MNNKNLGVARRYVPQLSNQKFAIVAPAAIISSAHEDLKEEVGEIKIIEYRICCAVLLAFLSIIIFNNLDFSSCYNGHASVIVENTFAIIFIFIPGFFLLWACYYSFYKRNLFFHICQTYHRGCLSLVLSPQYWYTTYLFCKVVTISQTLQMLIVDKQLSSFETTVDDMLYCKVLFDSEKHKLTSIEHLGNLYQKTKNDARLIIDFEIEKSKLVDSLLSETTSFPDWNSMAKELNNSLKQIDFLTRNYNAVDTSLTSSPKVIRLSQDSVLNRQRLIQLWLSSSVFLALIWIINLLQFLDFFKCRS